MANALVGYTGFVGSNLLRQAPFEGRYNTKNVEAIAGQTYDLLVVAGAPAEKWKANRNPEADGKAIGRLTAALEQVNAAQVVLISTVDVYPEPVEVDEGAEIDSEQATPFGRHRFGLEVFLAARFNTLVVRLPIIYGPGLKKNVLFDLLHEHNLEVVHADSAFQFYGLDRLWADVQAALAARLRVVNLVSEPVSVREVAKEAFGMEFDNQPKEANPAKYDVRSRFAKELGGKNGYLQTKEQALAGIAAFVQAQRQKR
ncbi:MAG TPA: pyridine nucleotide transhydrogenase [Myxococcaceae bacterium]|nr:pyridine nucleotide transhydrogenase [Myxococcaceae bacterium]